MKQFNSHIYEGTFIYPYVKPILEEYYYDTGTIHVRINYIARCKDRKEIYRRKL